ncbi:MAG: molecular chaperone HtpG [Peptostreptococcaceae bacterium]|nr:molecular chaperone HtpG [Peptostreptococcaceae bacterium]
MAVKQFKAESKRLLDLMIHSIYTNKEIFIRELISNASDAIDKMYYKALNEENIDFNRGDYYITISVNKEKRLLIISDTGIGMSKEDLDNNLGIIAQSGSLAFKDENETHDGYDIIGQFGVGFYSAFMVADKVTVISKPYGSQEAFKWESKGAEGYSVTAFKKDSHGTEIILKIKENFEDENYDIYLEEYEIKRIIKKYSDFISYPIKMGDETINSMVPIWRKNKNELKKEDYENFYSEKHYGFDKPLKYFHVSVDGAVKYNAILYIPSKPSYDFYTKEYEKGLELYSSGVMIMNKCGDLLPDYFGFVQGLVDSEDLSLNISREMLQHDRQLRLIAKKIKEKIKSELLNMQKNSREKYEEFFKSFGKTLKYGVYSEFGKNKTEIEDLLLFYSSKEKKLISLEEYIIKMPEDQKYIYYASGESYERIEKLPQVERVTDKGYEILYFTDEIDEFAIQMIHKFKDKEFRSVSAGENGISDSEEDLDKKLSDEEKELIDFMKEELKDKVKDVRISKRLKTHPVCLTADGALSIEMEKILNSMPESEGIKADKILEINENHEIYQSLKKLFENDKEKLKQYTYILYNQALLIEGLDVEDPVELSNKICDLMK